MKLKKKIKLIYHSKLLRQVKAHVWVLYRYLRTERWINLHYLYISYHVGAQEKRITFRSLIEVKE